jgi:hypothetical protein
MTVGSAEIQWLIAGIATAIAIAAAIGTGRVAWRSHKLKIARDQILAYLRANQFTMVSLQGIQESINSKYDNDFLLSLPDYFPNQLRRAKLRDAAGKLTRLGLAKVPLEELQEESEGDRSATAPNPR